jgi:hypothetical protein
VVHGPALQAAEPPINATAANVTMRDRSITGLL